MAPDTQAVKKPNASKTQTAQPVEPVPKPEPRAAAKKTEPGALVYTGPNWTSLGLVSSTVFKKGKLPPQAQAAREADPHLAALFVPLSGFPVARMELKDPGSGLSMHYQAVLKASRAGKGA